MSVIVLHLTDIHIKEKSDHILNRTPSISAALNSHLRGAEQIIIIVTGDISQSGQKNEYALAEKFFGELVKEIRQQTETPIAIFASPGNHDCDFSGDQEARTILLATLQKRANEIPDSIISIATGVQVNFFSFKNSLQPSAPRFTHPLWHTHELDINGKKIFIDLLNASWMSTIHEKQGGLIFPYEKFKDFRSTDCDLRVVALHHPFNWYGQVNYHKFRSFITALGDIVLTGHEHESGARLTDDVDSGECAFIEGAVLQARENAERSGFNIIEIDISTHRFRYTPYSLSDSVYEASALQPEWSLLRALPKRALPDLALTEKFREVITDPGASLAHPSGIGVSLSDIYVFPDLDSRTDKREKTVANRPLKLSSKLLLDAKKLQKNVLLTGTEASGKTCLLYRIFEVCHSNGLLPLLIKGKDIRKKSTSELQKTENTAIIEQYGAANLTKIQQSSKELKLLLIDDFDLCPLNDEARVEALTALSSTYGRTIVTVGENFELAEFLGGVSQTFSEFDQYQISPFGYERRGELVRRWMSIGSDETQSPNQLLKLIDDAESLIENAQLQHVAPAVPIYVLSLLQAAAAGMSKDLHNSSFAHYYYFLVVGALTKGGVKADGIAAYIAACTHLSWFIKTKGLNHHISRSEFTEFVRIYSDEWTETDPVELEKVLVASRLIDSDSDGISFTYPYSYYYFLGRYASISLERPGVREYLKYCVENLYVRECANTLLFLAHHSGNSEVLDHIISALKDYFQHRNPVTLAREDAQAVGRLIAYAPQFKHRTQKPSEYRKEIAQRKDREEHGDGLVDQPSTKKSLFENMVGLTKSIEIAGALLTHQYSNYPKAIKVDAVSQIFTGAMRAVREFYSFFDEDSEELIRSISLKIKRTAAVSDDQAEQMTRLSIGMLLRAIGAGFINVAGSHLRSDALIGHVEEVVKANPTQAFKLIRIAQKLQSPQRLPRLEINRLVKDEKDNPCVMGPLQLLVFQRMYMYETEYDDRDWASSVFELGGAKTHVHGPARHRDRFLSNRGS
ncbi:3',5'-cyclic AMP phosphodiesterase CpdA [Variovorax sp. OK605]|jgi:hypothetical protein|uniref:STAND family AAA ATPase n=1 Tax=Variovorax sp. OK605 TaxID=1855317 RepID=UPI0008F0A40A|nr:metallophosphoesterase [Variovorax sp. OK605]SFQ41490.1 3',5'-cyclic AMP phosphodiesterase CpdA [Variovorax sp. OK605]